MRKLDFFLAVIAVACALAVITSEHRARKLVLALEHEREHSRELEVEWGQLQLEQSTWATPLRVEKIAQSKLHMAVPDSKQIVLMTKP